MNELSKFSKEDLEKELESRKKKEQENLIKPKDNPDFNAIVKLAEDNLKSNLSEGYDIKDFDHWAGEAVMISVYGDDIYEKLKQLRK